jgi:hypothetical protein
MASNITVKIHLEPFLKRYLINHVSTVKTEPIRFPKNHSLLIYLFDLLISKREYEHRKIIENYIHNYTDCLEIMLPWNKYIDIRNKHYLSPDDEKKFKACLLEDFYFVMYRYFVSESLRNYKLVNAIVDEMAVKFEFSHELDSETIKQKIYRQIDSYSIRRIK